MSAHIRTVLMTLRCQGDSPRSFGLPLNVLPSPARKPPSGCASGAACILSMSLLVFAKSSHALLKEPSALLTSCALGSLRLYPPLEMDSASYESMAAPIAPEPDNRAIKVTPTTAVRASVESRKDADDEDRATGSGTLRNSKSQRQNGTREIASLRGRAEAPLCGSKV